MRIEFEPYQCIGIDRRTASENAWHSLQWCKKKQQSLCSREQAVCTKWACLRQCNLRAPRILGERRGCCRERDQREQSGNAGRRNCGVHRAWVFSSSSCRLQRLVLTRLKLVCLPLQEFTSWNLLMRRATEREWDRVDHLPCYHVVPKGTISWLCC